MDAQANTFGLAITRITKEAHKAYAPVLATWGLAPGMQSYLLAMDPLEAVPQKALAGMLGVDPGNVSRALQSLSAQGLVIRDLIPGSQRDYRVKLSCQGRQARADLETCAQSLVQAFASRIATEEWTKLVHLLTQVAQL